MSEAEKPNWWSRNWKIAVPVGCLTLVLMGVGLVAGIMAFIRAAGPFEEAMARARASCVVEQELGLPIEAGWIVSGSVNVSGPSGNAAVSFPVEGSRAPGRLHVVAYKQAGPWEFERLQLESEGRYIDLLAPRNERCEPSQVTPKARKP